MDSINPGKTTDPSGNFCVLMSLRFIEETATDEAAMHNSPAPAIAA